MPPFKELRLALLHKTQSMLSEQQQSSLVFILALLLAIFDEHVSEDTQVAMVKNDRAYPPNPLS